MESQAKLALCHEWLTTYGGSELVASRIAELLDVTDVFVYAAEPQLATSLFPGRRVVEVSGRLASVARKHWQLMLPLMIPAWRRLDVGGYDGVVTSSHSCTNSIR